ncbi:hypothetical protein T492DRAFT_1092121 [Pavlovales sp. CCMP2436]|nr:hypothetical protein T492DRAFT_1092121 [Pavlovales sp. CCMP2436]
MADVAPSEPRLDEGHKGEPSSRPPRVAPAIEPRLDEWYEVFPSSRLPRVAPASEPRAEDWVEPPTASAPLRPTGVPVVVPLGFHCAPSIINDVLGHASSHARMRTPFALGVFPPAAIAQLLGRGLSAAEILPRELLARPGGAPARFADYPAARAFAHHVIVLHTRYGFVFNHDFAETTSASDGDGGGVIRNFPWVRAAYEAKCAHLKATLRRVPPKGVVLCTVASSLLLCTGVEVRVPPRAQLVAEVAAALAAVRKLARDEGGAADAVAGVVLLYAPGRGAEPASADAHAEPDVVLEELPAEVAVQLANYGQIPVPQRAVLYREVYCAFLRGAARLCAGELDFPRWEETRFAMNVLGREAGPEAAKLRQRPCTFYQQGRCHFGELCKFAHVDGGRGLATGTKADTKAGTHLQSAGDLVRDAETVGL